jgi:hypothetical protein
LESGDEREVIESGSLLLSIHLSWPVTSQAVSCCVVVFMKDVVEACAKIMLMSLH